MLKYEQHEKVLSKDSLTAHNFCTEALAIEAQSPEAASSVPGGVYARRILFAGDLARLR